GARRLGERRGGEGCCQRGGGGPVTDGGNAARLRRRPLAHHGGREIARADTDRSAAFTWAPLTDSPWGGAVGWLLHVDCLGLMRGVFRRARIVVGLRHRALALGF